MRHGRQSGDLIRGRASASSPLSLKGGFTTFRFQRRPSPKNAPRERSERAHEHMRTNKPPSCLGECDSASQEQASRHDRK